MKGTLSLVVCFAPASVVFNFHFAIRPVLFDGAPNQVRPLPPFCSFPITCLFGNLSVTSAPLFDYEDAVAPGLDSS